MGIRYGDRTRVSGRVSEWLNGPDASKVVAVDVFDGTHPNMTLSGGMFIGTDGLVCNRTNNNYATVSNPTVNRHTGDMEVIVRASLDDWTPGSTQYLVSYARHNDSSNVNYSFLVNTTGTLELSRPSTVNRFFTSTVATGFTDGDSKWLRVTFDQNNGSSQSEVKFYTAADSATVPTVWTQLGATVTSSDVGAGRSADQNLWLGSGYTSTAGDNGMNGVLRRAIIKDGIDGTATLDADFDAQPYGTFRFVESSSNGRFVTVTSPASWTANWTAPAGAVMARVLCVGSGGAGGSGRKGATGTTIGGGHSGGGGGASLCEFEIKELPSTVTVTVGQSGIGGASQTTNSTDGFGGGSGGSTRFGSYCGAGGGTGGGAGLASGGGSFAGGGNGLMVGTSGQQRNFGTGPAAQIAPGLFGVGGTSGGTIVSNVAGIATVHSAGTTRSVMSPAYLLGVGGQGSAASTTGNASAGGNGTYGCGGGGGGASVDSVGDSGAGGNGGNGYCIVVSYRDCDIQGFTASGTWTKPVGDYTVAKVFVVGAGGGGGSGGLANGLASGGGGGGSGGSSMIEVPFASLPDTVTVTCGLGGTGGAAQTTATTPGNNGNNGGESSFGSILYARGGTSGSGGRADANNVAGGVGGVGASYAGAAGGNGNTVFGSNGSNTTASYTGGGGGGGGNANVARTGGAGGIGAAYLNAVTTTATATGTAGTNGVSILTGHGFFAGIGGGGAGSLGSGDGFVGGSGIRGSGGGGGSAGANTFTSGAGGPGGDGYVCVVCV